MKQVPGQYQSLHAWGILSGIMLVTLAAPVPLGSNRPLVWFGLAAAIYGLLAVWAIGRLLLGIGTTRIRSRYQWIMTTLLVWLGLLWLQTIELPEVIVRALSPFAYGMQKNLALISIGTHSSLSVDSGESYGELLKYGAYVALFFLVLATVTTRRRLLAMVTVLIVGGILEALFGLYVSVSGYTVFPGLGGATGQRAGSFVNPGHFGTMLMLVFCLTSGVVAGLVNAFPRTKKGAGMNRLLGGSWALAGLCTASLVMPAAAVAVGAWEPVVFAGVALIVMMLLALWSGQKDRGEYLVAAVVAAFAIVVLGTTVFMLGLSGLWSEEWLEQNRLGLGMLSEVWLTGVGAGNYKWVFQMFRDDTLPFSTYDHAHNDYMESAIEQGIPVMLVLGASVLLIFQALYRGYRLRRNPWMRGIIFGCLAAMIYMMLISLIQFSFRIPANAVYFFVIVAAGLAACRVERGSTGTAKSKREVEC